MAILSVFTSDLKPDFGREANYESFSIDSDLLRDDPQVVFRKALFESVKSINSVSDYKNYGIVVSEAIVTTNPTTQINRIIKQTTGASNSQFREYLVLTVDKAYATLNTYLATIADIYKATGLLRCSSDIEDEIPKGSFVKLEYDNSRKEQATIIKIYGQLPPVLEENPKAAASDAFSTPPCTDTSNITPSTDPIGGQSTPQDVNSSQAPTPNMTTKPCSVIQRPVSSYSSLNEDEKISKYFTIGQLIVTSQPYDNTPNQEEIERLKFLAVNILDKLRDKYGEFNINSAFRSEAVNNSVGGAKASQHRLGTAADIKFYLPSNEDVFNLFDKIRNDTDLQYDQLIFECERRNSYWFHISVAHPTTTFTQTRRQSLSWGPWCPKKSDGSRAYLSYTRNSIELRADDLNLQFRV